MVGLVIVSHSAKIAEGVREMAEEISTNGVKIATAGGLADGSMGTDAVRIMEAVKEADSGDGVLVLCDIGSSIMSAEMALELLNEEQDGGALRSVIADAPLVEGAIAAAAEAGGGTSLEEVKAAAEETRTWPKL